MAQEQADIIGLGDCTDTSMVVHVSSALKCLLAVHRHTHTHMGCDLCQNVHDAIMHAQLTIMHDGSMHNGGMHDGSMHDGSMHNGCMHNVVYIMVVCMLVVYVGWSVVHS